jgi:hypothetical protein
MKVAIHQPNFLPWGGFFQKYSEADVFISLNDCEFSKGGYTNRVKMKDTLVTIHVQGKSDLFINEVLLNEHKKRLVKLQKQISQLYTNIDAEFFDILEMCINYDSCTLSTFNQMLNHLVVKKLNLGNKFAKSEDMNVFSCGSDRILDLCLEVGATEYITGTGGLKYLDLDKFRQSGVIVTSRSYGRIFKDSSIMDILYD